MKNKTSDQHNLHICLLSYTGFYYGILSHLILEYKLSKDTYFLTIRQTDKQTVREGTYRGVNAVKI